ncbi:MAG: PHP domain-containing protein [Gemmatimonadetes bacterium]|nr:PHP domain-containing protein [Gemmatimonadota bacterium]MCA9762361.1 PHP domain-containing protein [Gemmatimonadota bacterium]MCB9518795.1 PHP domain-containing protein [Gemmatimonadales bacterium]HPF60489.1 PHP domain-containing protein [Gemmatimonadales bacterium]HRX18485.1 PHP domain-containing protein [Gemmatimonadales bacterium]
MIDLHCHSTASDGLLPPARVVEAASAAGLTAIALTDHDTTAGLAEARAAGARLGVRVIGGCEFSVAAPWGEMHLLGYFLEPDDPEIEAFLATARRGRVARGRAMVSALRGLGVPIALADVEREAGGGALGRPHVARALQRLGVVPTVQAAFDRYLGRNRPAYVEKVLPTLGEVADLVHRRGGIVSAAHLKSHGTREVLVALQADGLDAVEVRHPSHDGDRVAILTDAALALDLGRTGGSDWHGDEDGVGTHAALGSQQVPEAWLPALEARRPAVAP